MSGPLTELGFYFKDPDGDPSGLSEQYTALLSFADRLRESR
jgi:myo-inositol-1-phosphate synthase